MTTANKISIFRILLVPIFVAEVLYYVETGAEIHRILAIVWFGVASVSDAVDGYIARRFHQRSQLGSILDPLGDKLLLVSGIVLLSFEHGTRLPRLPLWLALTVLSREMLLLIGLVVIHHFCGTVAFRPAMIGKVATVLQMVCVLWALLQWPARGLFYLALGAAVCTGIAGVLYVIDGARQLSASPSSNPCPKE